MEGHQASSTPRATARCCRSFTSTATRSPARRCSAARPTTSIRSHARGARLRGALRRRRSRSDAGAPRARGDARYVRRADPVDPGMPRASGGARGVPRWPMIVLRTPKGWTGPQSRRRPARRGHVPRAPGAARRRAHGSGAPRDARGLDAQLSSPSALFDDERPLVRARCARWRRKARGAWARTRTRTAAGSASSSTCPRSRPTRSTCPRRAPCATSRRARSASCCATSTSANPTTFPAGLPRRDQLEPARRGVRGRDPLLPGAVDRDRRPRLARRPRDGGAQRAQLPGLARGLRAHRPPRRVRDLRGVRADRRVDGDAAREVARDDWRPAVARAGAVAQLPADVDVLAQRPQRLLAIRGPASWTRSCRRRAPSRASTCRPTRTACSRSPTTAFAARTTSTSIIIDKQPQLQWLDLAAAREHCARGASIWAWAWAELHRAATAPTDDPDVVLACAGDIADARDARGGGVAARARARAARARRQRRRSDEAVLAARAPARHDRRACSSRCSRATPTSCFSFHGYPGAHPSAPARASPRGAVPRPRLRRRRHHDDAVRHGRAQRDQPLPPRDRRDPARAPAARRTPRS